MAINNPEAALEYFWGGIERASVESLQAIRSNYSREYKRAFVCFIVLNLNLIFFFHDLNNKRAQFFFQLSPIRWTTFTSP